MKKSQSKVQKHAHLACIFGLIAFSVGVQAQAEDISNRIQKAVTVLNKVADSSGHGARSEEVRAADCIAVIPGFKKGAAVVGVGYGKGFIACRNGEKWSAPATVTLEGGSVGVQLGGETIDVVILSLDKQKRSKILSDRFTIGSDASAAWGNGKTAHGDPNAKILFFGYTRGAFAGFDLDGATVKPDESGNKALYGETMTNSEIVDKAATPAVAQPFMAKLQSLVRSESTANN